MKRKKLILIPLSLMCALSFTSCRKDTPTGSSSNISESTNSGSSGTKSESTNSGSSNTTPSESSSSKSESTTSSQSSGSSSQSSTHTHNYATDWSKDANKHWHDDTCGHGTKIDEAEHTYSDGVETEDGKTKYTCTVCGYEKIETSKLRVDEATWKNVINTTTNFTVDQDITHNGSVKIVMYATESQLYVDEVTAKDKYIYKKDGDKYYQYSLFDGDTEWIKKEITEEYYNTSADATYILKYFLNEYSKFTFNTQTKKYTLATLAINNHFTANDISFGFNDGKITDLEFVATSSADASYSSHVTLKDFGTTEVIQTPTNVHEHTYATTYTYNDSEHWLAATCGHDIYKDKASHTMVDGACSVCGYKVPTDGLVYELSSDGLSYALIKDESYTDLTGEVVIASYYNGKPVTRIDKNAFESCDEITAVQIPNTVTSIGKFAFLYCGIQSIDIPNSVTIIEEGAFSLTNLTSVTIPNSVTIVESQAFYRCDSIKSVTLSNKITKIDELTFYRCSSLENITIPSNVKSIGDSAFAMCSKLANVIIPDGVEKIGDSAFYHCDSLESIVIPDSVTIIDTEAFGSCEILKNVTLSNNLTHFDSKVFLYTDHLKFNEYNDGYYLGSSNNPYMLLHDIKPSTETSFEINENCKMIYDNAFKGSYITSIVIPDSVISIGSWAFDSCSDLQSVTLSNNLIYIGTNAFHNCTSLTYNEYEDGYYLGSSNNKYLALVKTKSTEMTTFNINDSCKIICNEVFYYCSSLTNITIPNSVVCIGEDAFKYCTSLTNITLSSNLMYIGDMAFFKCTSLSSLVIPSSVTYISDDIIDECSEFSNLYYLGTIEQWYEIILHSNEKIEEITINYYSESTPTDTTHSYWHYVDGVPTSW